MSPTEYQELVEFLGRRFGEVDRRFDEMDNRFTGLFTEFRQEMLGHFDEIYRRLERLETEPLQARIAAIEERLSE